MVQKPIEDGRRGSDVSQAVSLNLPTGKHNAPEGSAFPTTALVPKIAVSALLELALWCELRLESQGGEPCLTTTDGPQTKKGRASGCIESAVGSLADGRPSRDRQETAQIIAQIIAQMIAQMIARQIQPSLQKEGSDET